MSLLALFTASPDDAAEQWHSSQPPAAAADLVDLAAARGLVALRPATWLKLLLRREAIASASGEEEEIGRRSRSST